MKFTLFARLGDVARCTRTPIVRIGRVCLFGGSVLVANSVAFAQVDNASARHAESILIGGEEEPLTPAPAAEITRTPSVQENLEIDGGENPFYTQSPSDQSGTVKVAPSTTDPASLPSGVNHADPIQQIIENGTLSQFADASAPVAWPGFGAYNPTARVMLKNWCVDGLWCTFPAERAEQCAKIQKHLAGHQWFGQHGNACASGSCSAPSGVVNRYLSAPSKACDKLPSCATCQNAPQTIAPIQVSSNMVPMVPKPVIEDKANVASRPVVVR